jgi:hypothetical protein
METEDDCDDGGEPLVTDAPTAGDGSITTLESLPDGGLSMAQIDTLGDGDTLELAAPLVIDITTSRVTHLDLVVDETHHFVGWNPTERQWEQILVVVDEADDLVLESTIGAFDDESGEPATTPSANPETEEIAAFVWEYVEHTYPDTTHLFNVMNQALEELSTTEE